MSAARKLATPPPEPVQHLCDCGAWGSFGLGPPAQFPARFWCADCLPDDYWKGVRNVPS